MLCFVHSLHKAQFTISNCSVCSTETFAPFSQRLSAILKKILFCIVPYIVLRN